MDASSRISDALARLLCDAACQVGVAEHTYIVGGAPRDFVLGFPVKDIDVVLEQMSPGQAHSLALKVAATVGLGHVHPDQYGVIHVGPFPRFEWAGVDLTGQKVEIVTARREKYDKSRVKESHKPVSVEPGTILEDLLRRDFTMNTLVWRLSDLREGIERAPVLDLLQQGLQDLHAGVIRTPLDPEVTFDEDPSRMLRAVRFAVKYDFTLHPSVKAAIRTKAGEVTRLPYEVLDSILFDKVLTLSNPVKALTIAKGLGLLDPIVQMIPPSRVRRAIDGTINNVALLLALSGFGMLSHISSLPKGHQRLLRRLVKRLPNTEVQNVYARFNLPPVHTPTVIAETGIQGAKIRQALNRARDILLEQPHMSGEKLQAQLIRELQDELLVVRNNQLPST